MQSRRNIIVGGIAALAVAGSAVAARIVRGPVGASSYEFVQALGVTSSGMMMLLISATTLTIIGAMLLAKRVGVSNEQSAILGILVAASPVRIAQATQGAAWALALPVAILGAIALTAKHRIIKILGALIIISTGFAGAEVALGATILAIGILLANKDQELLAWSTVLVVGQTILVGYTKALPTVAWELRIVDIGSSLGIGIFEASLVAIAISLYWRKRPAFALGILSCALLAVAFNDALPFFALLASELTRQMIKEVVNQEWSDTMVKSFTILLVVCGLAFSSIAYAKWTVDAFPAPEDHEIAERIAPQLTETTLIIPQEKRAFIETQAKQTSQDISKREENQLKQGRSLETVESILAKHQITQVVVLDQEEFNNIVFVLENPEQFTKVIEIEDFGIWSTKEETFINSDS